MFWVDFTKKLEKKAKVRVVVEIVKCKSQRQLESLRIGSGVSKLSLRCILDFWNKSVNFWVEKTETKVSVVGVK